MARSSCCYVVLNLGLDRPVKAFTVKHELVTWFHRRGLIHDTDHRVWRCSDGLYSDREPSDITEEVRELAKENT